MGCGVFSRHAVKTCLKGSQNVAKRDSVCPMYLVRLELLETALRADKEDCDDSNRQHTIR